MVLCEKGTQWDSSYQNVVLMIGQLLVSLRFLPLTTELEAKEFSYMRSDTRNRVPVYSLKQTPAS